MLWNTEESKGKLQTKQIFKAFKSFPLYLVYFLEIMSKLNFNGETLFDSLVLSISSPRQINEEINTMCFFSLNIPITNSNTLTNIRSNIV